MPKPKRPYVVYIRMNILQDGLWTDGEWEYAGKTWAVSTAQAKNNIRHRMNNHTLEWGSYTGSDAWDYEYELKAVEDY